MTVEGQYLTYAEYQALGGSAIGNLPFNVLEFEARRRIDERTHNRLIGQEIPDEVKMCMFSIINKVLVAYDEETTRGISSESVGSYSVSYNNDMKQIIENKKSEIEDIILTYLYGVVVNDEHIIYCGV